MGKIIRTVYTELPDAADLDEGQEIVFEDTDGTLSKHMKRGGAVVPVGGTSGPRLLYAADVFYDGTVSPSDASWPVGAPVVTHPSGGTVVFTWAALGPTLVDAGRIAGEFFGTSAEGAIHDEDGNDYALSLQAGLTSGGLTLTLRFVPLGAAPAADPVYSDPVRVALFGPL